MSEQNVPSSLATVALEKEVQEALERVQAMGISVSDAEGVREYLLRFPDMVQMVAEVCKVVREKLPDAQLHLVTYSDPEIEGYDYLVLNARFREYDETTMDRIEEAEASYIDELAKCRGWLLLTTDFVPAE